MPGLSLWLCVLLAVGCSDADKWDVQELCDKLMVKLNTFADMVPFIVPISFPANNDYFLGDAEVIFYSAEGSYPNLECTVLQDKDLTLFRMDTNVRMVILNQGSRIELMKCNLEIHIRLQKDNEHLFLDPQFVDVLIPGNVYRDGILLDENQANEILRPTLIKGFTTLATQYLTYSGYRGKAVFVDPSAAATLLKQIVLSYASQIVL